MNLFLLLPLALCSIAVKAFQGFDANGVCEKMYVKTDKETQSFQKNSQKFTDTTTTTHTPDLRRRRSERTDDNMDIRHRNYRHGRHSHHHGIEKGSKKIRGVGGEEVRDLKPYAFGFYVIVMRLHNIRDDGGIERIPCGGTLLTHGWVLTARHCLSLYNDTVKLENMTVHVGISNYNLEKSEANKYTVESYVEFPQETDLVLLNLKQTVRTMQRGTTIPIVRSDDPLAKEVCVLSHLRNGRQMSYVTYFNMKTLDNEFCNNDREDETCTRPTAGYGPCFGDSGSPMVSYDAQMNTFVLEAVLTKTNNEDCVVKNPSTASYVRVAPCSDFIHKNVPGIHPMYVNEKFIFSYAHRTTFPGREYKGFRIDSKVSVTNCRLCYFGQRCKEL